MIRISTEDVAQMAANALGGPVLHFTTMHSGWSPQGLVSMGPSLEDLVAAFPALPFDTVMEMWSHHEGWVSFASAEDLNHTVSALSKLPGIACRYTSPETLPSPES